MLKKIKAIELVMDWNLWPRYEAETLDSTNVSRIKEAIKSGEELPPVIADKKSYRIIDGFHRTRSYLSLFGDDVEIMVDLREYESEQKMLAESARLNTIHGLALSPRDKVHVIMKLKKMKMPYPEICKVLGMTDEYLKTFLEKRTAKTEQGETIPLSYGASGLAGKTLNKEQEHFARTTNGTVPAVHVRLLINALKADALVIDENTKSLLIELKKLIERVIK